MSPLLFAVEPSVREVCSCLTFWSILVGAIGLWLLLPTRWAFGKAIGTLLVAIAGGLFAADLPRLGGWIDQGVLWLLAGLTLGPAIAMVSSRSPVYSAIWFALSLLGTAGLFLYQGAQFLSVATIVVYAGAIVVTFLFVIMLAQPEGNSDYDRLTWGGLPKVMSVLTAALLVGVLTFMTGRLKKDAALASFAGPGGQVAAAQADGGVLNNKHVANLGKHLFSEHLLSVELAGTLLLVGLVGAVAIAIHGRPRLAERIEEALR